MLKNENENKIISTISKEVARGRKRFIIYPFGEIGRQVKDILNNYFHITEDLIIDNGGKTKEVYPTEYLSSYDLTDKYVLICSNRNDIFLEIREAISSYVPQKRIIDIFEKDIAIQGIEYLSHMARISGLDQENIYLLKRYNVKFFLPFWKSDFIQRFILLNGLYYEDDYLFYVTKVFRGGVRIEGRTVLDIGANIGNHSLYFAKECKADKVIAFEPVKRTFEILQKNIEINGLEANIVPYNCGIGEADMCAFTNGYNMENIGGTSLRVADDGDIIIHAIDGFNFDDDIALIKIDVEGFEEKAIKGALKTITKNYPVIMLENWSWEIEKICKIITMLSSVGYDFKQVNANNYIFYPES